MYGPIIAGENGRGKTNVNTLRGKYAKGCSAGERTTPKPGDYFLKGEEKNVHNVLSFEFQ